MQRSENWSKDGGELGDTGISWKEPYSTSGKRGGKTHIPCLGTGRVGRSEAQGRQDRISLHVLGDWGHLVDLVPASSSLRAQSSLFASRAPLYIYSDVILLKEEKANEEPFLNTGHATNANAP